MSSTTYTPPVDQLLHYQECHEDDVSQWPDYPAQFGFTLEHVPDLVRMATDKALWDSEDELLYWAPWHALRSLGQLRAGEAAAALVDLFNLDDDWLAEELLAAFPMLGEPAFAPLAGYIADPQQDSLGRVTAVDTLGNLVKAYPELSDRASEFLQAQLQQFRSQGEGLNGILVQELVTLQVTAAAPLMQQVYEQGPVDQMFAGSWARVQVSLGLAQESDFTPAELKRLHLQAWLNF
ncbi:MAG: hypothetical protein HC886_08085 [Leptolyngbyaceae cyanobacterium SM1_1_3]|nr:hypothetical protein [Leptolyngbyaceae cyanobacterium SM1_1_3]